MNCRLTRLRALGAHIEVPDPAAQSLYPNHPLLRVVLPLVFGLLGAAAAVTCVAALLLFVVISLFGVVLLLVAIHVVFAVLTALKGVALG